MSLKPPIEPLYLIRGDNVGEMQKARDAILDVLLPREMRDENLTEYIGTGTRFGISFQNILGDLNADLSTMSLLADARKVAVVTNPVEIFESEFKARRKPAKAKKAKSKDKDQGTRAADDGEPGYLRWLKRVLPKTGNHLIIIAHTDESEDREIEDDNPLFQAITQAHGHVMVFNSGQSKAVYRIEDALVFRRPDDFFREVEGFWNAGRTDIKVYTLVMRAIRFMIQAGILRDPRIGDDPEKIGLLLPANPKANVTKLHSFPQQKYLRQPARYRLADLIKAHEGLIEVYLALRPPPGAVHVRDARLVFDNVMARLFASPAPGR